MTIFNKSSLLMTAAAALALGACTADVEDDTMTDDMATNDMAMDNEATTGSSMVGGAEMLASRNIVENASEASNLTTLVAAVKQADLVETLSGPGPFTVFAPTDDAFAKVDKATLDGLMQDSAKSDLANILTYHVVSGDVDAATLAQQIKDGDGMAELTTVAGGKLTAKMDGDKVVLTDEKGNMSTVTQADVKQSNGVVHVIDTVLMPS